jgi:hypothetical protein
MLFCGFLISAACVLAAGCKSPHVEITVVNQTGGEVRLLEVDYPSASFGADRLAPGASMRYNIALQGAGPMKVQYTGPGNAQQQATGTAVEEGQSGRLEIDLLPGGKAEFHPELHSRR